MPNLLKGFLPVLIILFVLSACSPSQTNNISVVVVTPSTPSTLDAYPPSDLGPQTEVAYPGPDPVDQGLTYPESIEVPKPDPERGIVTGRIVEAASKEVYLAPTLILGQMVFANDPSAPPLVSFSVETDPIGVEDLTGRFMFTDIEPGKYAIVVWTPFTQTLLVDSQGSTVQVDVEAGQVVDLGEIYLP